MAFVAGCGPWASSVHLSGLEDVRGPSSLVGKEGSGSKILASVSLASPRHTLPFISLFLAAPCLLCPVPLAEQAVG